MTRPISVETYAICLTISAAILICAFLLPPIVTITVQAQPLYGHSIKLEYSSEAGAIYRVDGVDFLVIKTLDSGVAIARIK